MSADGYGGAADGAKCGLNKIHRQKVKNSKNKTEINFRFIILKKLKTKVKTIDLWENKLYNSLVNMWRNFFAPAEHPRKLKKRGYLGTVQRLRFPKYRGLFDTPPSAV